VAAESASRLDVIAAVLGAVASATIGTKTAATAAARADLKVKEVDGIPYRPFGRAGITVSLLCVGGHHIGRGSEQEAIRIVQKAVDNGATFMDNAWEYHDGLSEERMGKALAGGRREKVFLMTKHHGRSDKKTSMKHLEDSLRRLRTDHIDLWQHHECVYDDDPDLIFSPGGSIEASDQAKKEGKVRYVGFTGHKKPLIHLKMLAYDYPWDAVQMPLNPFDGTYESFEKWVLPVLETRGIAVLAMKTRAGGALVSSGGLTAEECWRYVTGLPICTVVSGMESLELLRKNLNLARGTEPMSSTERKAIRERVANAAATGRHERYKTTRAFDGKVGRRIHGMT
jgi:aryl-alcohol dehydrogenase-like predicted oxidoreductase